MPSTLVARYMFPTERYRGEWRRHWLSPIRGSLLVALATALVIRASVIWVPPARLGLATAVIVAGGVLAVLDQFASWFLTRFVITNKRILVIQGVVIRRVAMLPLLKVTDMVYTQSPLGRALNYGTFTVMQSRWGSVMRRTTDLPRPNELYLRIVEEMYDPDAVEARLTEAVSNAVRDTLQGPTLVNYDGWVSVEVLDGQRPVTVSEDRRVVLVPGHRYAIVVTISGARVTPLTEPLKVTTGVDRPTVRFSIELDSDHPSFRQPAVELSFDRDGAARARFAVMIGVSHDAEPPWLWIRVSQANRTLQSIELLAEPSRDPG